MSELKRFRDNGRKYKMEDRYKHHLGILRAIIKELGLPENCAMSDIPAAVRKMVASNNTIKEAIDLAVAEGVSFVRVESFVVKDCPIFGISTNVVNSRDVVVTHRNDQAEAEGYVAGEHGAAMSHCDYEKGSPQYEAWMDGWRRANSEC